MTKQFNVGDSIIYTDRSQPWMPASWYLDGVILEVDMNHYSARGIKETCYSIKWADGSTNCMHSDNLELFKSAAKVEPTIQSAKELKAELESEILRLIQEFNKKTNLEVKDVSLVYYKDTIGYCQQVNIKVEI